MKISTKGRYAVRTLIDIAKFDKQGYVCLNEIAKRQNISIKYLEAIISKLVKGKILTSMRGTTGGYKLSRSPENITLKDILTITGDGPKLATCFETTCPRLDCCESFELWQALSNNINQFLTKTTLNDIINKRYI